MGDGLDGLVDMLLRDAGILWPPVSVVLIAAAIGIELRQNGHLPAALDGHLIRGRATHLITVNCGKPLTRCRFSQAHELGHLFLHDDDAVVFSGVPHYAERPEREANEFAARLVMPEPWVRAQWPRRSFDTLRQMFGVSRRAMSLRLHALGLITDRGDYPTDWDAPLDLWRIW